MIFIGICPISVRSIKRWVAPTLRELNKRRQTMGPEALTPRSSYTDWNYSAELYAFSQRLHEDFDMSALQQAFTHRSYVIQEQQRQREVGIEEDIIEIADNRPLIEAGQRLMEDYIHDYVTQNVPKDVPPSLIKSIVNYLMSNEVLANVSRHIGTTDLILAADFPVQDQTLIDTLYAIVAALSKCSGPQRAQIFVKDFIGTQLNQKDYTEFWTIDKPFEELQRLCSERKIGTPEPRIIGECGKNTLLAAFNVGIYCDRKMVGQGFGENYQVAISEASKDAIRELYNIQPNQQIIRF